MQLNRSELLDDGYESGGWALKLRALSADEPQRIVRFLTGVLLACGGWILTRSTHGTELAELDFEFARGCNMEIYAALVGSGLELTTDSHRQMAQFCHCTQILLKSKAFEISRVTMVIYSDKTLVPREREELLRVG
jgi:hypothetical protein